ncbi:MAG: M48 family metalloprotease [Cyanobacteria bacterium J06638_28]
MSIGKRFLVWTLCGIFLAMGSGGLAHQIAVGQAATPPAAIAQTSSVTDNTSDTADDLEPADSEPPEAVPSVNEDGTVNLPDFEPKLPSETPPPESPAESSEPTWSDGDLESSPGANEPEISARQRVLMTADEYYLEGDRATAETLYRQVKGDFWQAEDAANVRPEPIYDPAELSPAGAVYWREAQAGYAKGLAHRTLVPLEILVEDYPEFIPGQVFYANYLVEQERAEEADAVLDVALMLYPSQPELLEARTSVQMEQEQWIEAAITARQFTLLNPDHPKADVMATLSESNLDRFRAEMNADLTGNFIGNLITGTAGAILTGGLIGPYTAINSGVLLLQGESSVGAGAAAQIRNQAPMMEDPEVSGYLNTMGQKLADLAGRDEFEYEFHVIEDADLNAFALPGGKIFVNAGAITKTHSEAELAGLMAHEISHAVLSHGFQMVTNGNLVNSVIGNLPLPQVTGIAASLAFSQYSRQMERQADVLGTHLLAAAGYAADGMHSLMVTLEDEVGDRSGIQWFSSHPAPAERVAYLQRIVDVGGYNRYAYEGVEPHLAIQQRVQDLMSAA